MTAEEYATRELAEGRSVIDVIEDLQRLYRLEPLEAEALVSALVGEEET